MQIIYILILTIIISNSALASNNLFDTEEYELNFESENINQAKEIKINEIKIKSFNSILQYILTTENFEKTKTENINFINKFILNLKINDEKIVKNYYFSKIKINYNIQILIEYLIEKQIPFIDQNHSKFLIIISEKNNLQHISLSKENNFYNFLLNSKNKKFDEYLIIPNLDYNDRFLFNKYYFENNILEPNKMLNNKYYTTNQILINSFKKEDIIFNEVFFYDGFAKYYLTKFSSINWDYAEIIKKSLSNSLNKWKQINQIDTSLTNSLECKIDINNINQLKYVRNLLKSIKSIKELNLKSIKFNQNIYSILFFGDLIKFQKSLKRNRLNLVYDNHFCSIALI